MTSVGDERSRMATYLRVVRTAVAIDLRDDRSSPMVTAVADAAVAVLDRVIGDLVAAAKDAEERADAVRDLVDQAPFDVASGSRRTCKTDPVDKLEALLADLQSGLDANRSVLIRKLRDSDSSMTAWFASAVSLVAELAEDAEKRADYEDVAMSSEKVHASVGEDDPILAALDAYLVQRYPLLAPHVVEKRRIVPGGRAKETSIVALRTNPALPTSLVLRRDVPPGHTGTIVAGELPVLRRLEELGLAVPHAILAEADESVLGGSFLVMDEIADCIVGPNTVVQGRASAFTSEHYGRLGVQVARFLAAQHSIDRMPTAEGLPQLNTLSSDPAEVLADYRKRWAPLVKPPSSVVVDLAFAWLEANPVAAGRPIRLVHGDFGPHNFLMRGQDLVAVLDWELAHMGDPAEDLGYCRQMLLEPLIAWAEFADAYIDAGGDESACDPAAVDFFAVWAGVRNAVHVATKYDWLARGVKSDIATVNSSAHVFRTLAQFISRDLRAAGANRTLPSTADRCAGSSARLPG